MCSVIHQNSPDIDNGWAFVVMVCATFMMILTRGFSYTNAILFVTFLDEFQESTVFTAWVFSVNIFCSLSFCVVANALLLMVGPRITVTIGCIFSATGLLGCSFATNLTTILVMYGIVTGIGFACSFVGTFTAISLYFKRYRVIAYAIMSSGTGIGQFLLPPLLHALIEKYSWRGAFLIMTGITLNMLVIAASYMNPRLPMSFTIKQDVNSKKKMVKGVVRTLIEHSTMFKNPNWVLFCISVTTYNVGIIAFQTHLSNYGRVSGLTTPLQTYLPSITGIGFLCGSTIIGGITQHPKVPEVGMILLTNFVLGFVSLVVSVADNAIGLFTCSFGAGVSLATLALNYEVVIFIVGVERFSSGYSFAMLFAALGALLAGPLSASVYEVDPSYHWSYRVIGLIVMVGVILIIPVWLTVRDGKVKQKIAKDLRKTEGQENNSCIA